MDFVPRRVARKGQQKSTTKHISSIPSTSTSTAFTSTPTSDSIACLNQSKVGKGSDFNHGEDLKADDEEPTSKVETSTFNKSASEPHLAANALYYLLSPVYLIHSENSELRDTLTSLEEENGSKGVLEEGQIYLHLSRLLFHPIVSVLCSSISALTLALRQLEPLGFLQLSPSGYGLKLTKESKDWISNMMVDVLPEVENSLTRMEFHTIYVEDLPLELSTSLSIAQHLKLYTSLPILSVIPSISPLEPLKNLGQGLLFLSSPSLESQSFKGTEPSKSLPSFISSSNQITSGRNSKDQSRFSISKESYIQDSLNPLDWSSTRSKVWSSHNSIGSKVSINRFKLMEEVSNKRPRGGRALATFGPPFEHSKHSNLSEEAFVSNAFKEELKQFLKRTPWKDEKGKRSSPFRSLQYSSYKSLAQEYVEYKRHLHEDLGWQMSYSSSSSNSLNKLSKSSSVSHCKPKSNLNSRSEPISIDRKQTEEIFQDSDRHFEESLVEHMRIPSESELRNREFPHSTIVKIRVEIENSTSKSKEEKVGKKFNPKVEIQVKVDKLIQKEVDEIEFNSQDDDVKKVNGKYKEKSVDYVDWKEGEDFAYLRLSTSYHSALLLKSFRKSSLSSTTIIKDLNSSIKFFSEDIYILKDEGLETYWNSLPKSVRNSCKKREIKIWNHIEQIKENSKRKSWMKENENEDLEGVEVDHMVIDKEEENKKDEERELNGDRIVEEKVKKQKKKKKKGKKRKAADEVEDQNGKKHIRFD